MKNKYRIYLSHCIRGKKGLKATPKDMKKNCDEALYFANRVRAEIFDEARMNGWPDIELYVPAEHEDFIQKAYDKGFINEEQILDIDCEILNECDVLLAYGEYMSRGMKVEIDYAFCNNIPILFIGNLKGKDLTDSDKEALFKILEFIAN